MSKYKFNKEQLSFVEDKLGIKGKIRIILTYLVGSVLLAILYYLVIGLLFNFTEEERIVKENQLMAEEYKRVSKKMDVLDNVILDLQTRDKNIYQSIFKAAPPDFLSSEYNSRLYSQLDTSADLTLVEFTTSGAQNLEKQLSGQNARIKTIIGKISGDNAVTSIPSLIPIKGMDISQTGAGTGKKIHPFYKTPVEHMGLDLLAAIGTEVRATADGTVVDVTSSDRGYGNVVVIQHQGGYTSKYAHLGDILVRKSQSVKQNSVIARVGNSGLSFAPHLHYEVLKNGKVMDPVNYFFGDLTPLHYREMAIIAMSSGQSLD